jgi:hypothetical protein
LNHLLAASGSIETLPKFQIFWSPAYCTTRAFLAYKRQDIFGISFTNKGVGDIRYLFPGHLHVNQHRSLAASISINKFKGI